MNWSTASAAVLTEGERVLTDDPHRSDSVTTIGRMSACDAAHEGQMSTSPS